MYVLKIKHEEMEEKESKKGDNAFGLNVKELETYLGGGLIEGSLPLRVRLRVMHDEVLLLNKHTHTHCITEQTKPMCVCVYMHLCVCVCVYSSCGCGFVFGLTMFNIYFCIG
jgi:hypothetical protein